jgi:hypothetical protein
MRPTATTTPTMRPTVGHLPKDIVTGDAGVDLPSGAQPRKGNFITKAPSNIAALFRGEVGVGDVAKRIPGTALRGTIGAARTFVPGISKFFETTGGIIGEGLAYATNPVVRDQYKNGGKKDEGEEELLKMLREKRNRGEDTSQLIKSLEKLQKGKREPSNLEILPTTTKTDSRKLARYALAAGLETAIMRGIPAGIKGQIVTRAGVGALEGLGFAISEGIAKGHSEDEILKNAALYGVSGSVLNIAAPYLGPLLRKELGRSSKVATDAVRQATRQIPVKPSGAPKTRVPISTPNSRYEAYLRSQGYEPYIADIDLPTIQAGKAPRPTKSDLPTIQLEEPPISRPPPPGTRLVPEPTTPPVSVTRGVEPPQPKQAPTVSPGAAVPEVRPSAVEVPGETIPIGGPTKGAARLERRLAAKADDPAYQRGISALDDPELTGATNREQIRRASNAVESLNPQQIDDIIAGRAPLPEGVLRTSFLNAVSEKAYLTGNAGLVNRIARVASQTARRAGQEIQFTRNFDPLDPATNIADIIAVRTKAATNRLPGGKTVRGVVKENIKKGKAKLTTSQLKLKEAEDLINSIELC